MKHEAHPHALAQPYVKQRSCGMAATHSQTTTLCFSEPFSIQDYKLAQRNFKPHKVLVPECLRWPSLPVSDGERGLCNVSPQR